MARTHWWYFLSDSDGKPIVGAEIKIYLAQSDIPAYIFNSEIGRNSV